MSFDGLAAVVKPGLDGLLIPKANGAQDIQRIGAELDRLEAAAGMAPGSVRIAVVATETPLAMFNLASYTPPHPRLAARSEEHTSELQSLMRNSYPVFCL